MKKITMFVVALFVALQFAVSANAGTPNKEKQIAPIALETTFQVNLNPGDTGEEVIHWQKFLASQGLFNGKYAPRVGPLTIKGTKEFQRKHGLDADAIVGNLTRSAARREVTAKATVTAQVKTSPVRPAAWKSVSSKVTVQTSLIPTEKKLAPGGMNKSSGQSSARRISEVDPNIDPRSLNAADIASKKAKPHSTSKCWRFVKRALLAAGVIQSYPKTEFAKQAARELVEDYGFKKLPVSNPYAAPRGSVLVYNGSEGHVEIRTKDGFVSDFRTPNASRRTLIGVYAKM